MTISSGRLDDIELLPHVLRETTDSTPHAIWLPQSVVDGSQAWERTKAAPRDWVVAGTWQVIPAAIDTVRERRPAGWWSKIFRRGRRDDGGDTVFIPNGTTGTRTQLKRRDAILVSADASTELNTELLRAQWPAAERFQQLGRNLWLVVGAVVSPDGGVNR